MHKNKVWAAFFLLGVITMLGAFCFSKVLTHNYPKEDFDSSLKHTVVITPEKHSAINVPTTKEQAINSVPETKEQSANSVPETKEQITNSVPVTKVQPKNSVPDTSFIINNQGSNLNNLYKYSDNRSGNETYNVYSAQTLSICNQVGNITVYEDEVKDLRLTTSISVKADSKEIVNELIDNIMINTEENNNIFTINVLNKKNKTDYWNWKTTTYPLSYVNIDFKVTVPRNFKSFNINDSTGDIKVSNISGALKINNLTGDINIINANLVEDNAIDVKTGSVNVKADLSTAKTLVINTMTGSINLSVLKDKGISLDASLITGNIGGKYNGGLSADNNSPGIKSVSKVYSGGTTHVTLKTFTGDINVD